MNEVQSRSNAGSSPGGQGIPAEEAKLREEIRSLKQQRLLAILRGGGLLSETSGAGLDQSDRAREKSEFGEDVRCRGS